MIGQFSAVDYAFSLLEEALNAPAHPSWCGSVHSPNIRTSINCGIPAGHKCAHGAVHLGRIERWGDGEHCYSTHMWNGLPLICVNPEPGHKRHYVAALNDGGRPVHEWGEFRGRHMAEVVSGVCDPDDEHDRAKETREDPL